MDIKPENLEKLGYKIINELNHNELIPFVKEQLNQKTKFSRFYKLFNISLLVIIIFIVSLDFFRNLLNFSEFISHLTWALALCVLLIPIHEWIHLAAYKWLGAPKVRIDSNFKKFYFMAIAPGFVVNKKEFTIIALAPYLSITFILALLYIIYMNNQAWFLLIALFIHTGFCSGDFALLSYSESCQNDNWITYDDFDKKMSYFFVK